MIYSYRIPLGLIGVQTTVQAMVEVMWGFMEASPTNVTIVLPHLVEMLLSEVNNSFYHHSLYLHLSVVSVLSVR